MSNTKKNEVYKRKTEEERQQLFLRLARDIGHPVINITPPKNKEQIKNARKDSGLSGSEAAAVCGVSRKTWTMWENHKKDTGSKKTPETYPSDWQWGWFLLAVNKHPELRLIEQSDEALNANKFGMKEGSNLNAIE
ncbi:MAG: helix-turn-helix transcriptional regulator [Psychrobacter sp.]|nr:helix-turn-helix transcriptional regulator [Psychrobacter sp.]